MLPRNSVLLNPSVLANLYQNLNLRRNVWMYPRRSVLDPEQTQGRSRSQLSRNGATSHLRSLALLKSSLVYLELISHTQNLAHKKTSCSNCQDTKTTKNEIQ